MDCHDALEMICNLEADGDEKAAFTLCSGFLTRQILQEDSYCAWQVTNVYQCQNNLCSRDGHFKQK